MSKEMQPKIRFSGFTDDWEQRKLGNITKITMGQSPNGKNYTDNPNDAILVQGNADMVDGWVNPRVWTTQITKEAKKGDLLLSVRAPVGNVSKTKYDVVLGRGVAAIEGNEFLFQLLSKMNESGYWSMFSTGSTFDSINSNEIKNALALIPTKKEQTQIGTFLNMIDKLIASNQRKLDQLKELKKLFMQKIFDQEWRFKGFTAPWEQRKFKMILNENDGIRRGPFGSALKKEYFVSNGPYVVYEQQNAIYDNYQTRYRISKEKFQELNKFSVHPGDFIMSGAGTIGKLSYVPQGVPEGVFNQALIRLRINKNTNPWYFLQFMRSEFMQKKLTEANPGSAMTNLVPMSELKNWEVQIPQKKEQSAIGSLLMKLDQLIASNQQKVDQLKNLKRWFMQNLFI